ncbi:hypothetical protein VDGE_30128 [Verticillium dahliae]|uniref:Uncharacterized protein n=1 Tax=Verticillium dahliae TaxID=27337 RepID=A0A444RZN3_VERDA|nr:hypothetical protein VDGE_30128 [Verticillium dahliae]
MRQVVGASHYGDPEIYYSTIASGNTLIKDTAERDRIVNQRYASATTTAYAKELLAYIPAVEVQETKRALEVMQSVD